MKLRAPIRYWGSKVRMAPWIIERLPAHNHYIEACAGSAAVMAVKEPVRAETLNDTYGEIVNFFRVLRDDADELIDRVAFTPYSQREFVDAGALLESDDRVERAWAFFVRMQMAVVPGKSGWSYGVKGPSAHKANRPGRWSTMPELLQLAAARFQRVQISDWDVLELIERLDAPGALIFIDPPYIKDSRPKSVGSGKTAYVNDDFDHGALLDAISTSKNASFAITHYPHELYDSSGLTSAGDYGSYSNTPNGEGRSERIERLYVLDRT